MACGVFGNVPDDHVRQTIAALPSHLTAMGTVIWTRGRGDDGTDRSTDIRGWFTDSGFTELSFTAPTDARFRVGMHRLGESTTHALPPEGRMFSFL